MLQLPKDFVPRTPYQIQALICPWTPLEDSDRPPDSLCLLCFVSLATALTELVCLEVWTYVQIALCRVTPLVCLISVYPLPLRPIDRSQRDDRSMMTPL